MKRSPRLRAVTMMEMLLVMVLIGIMASIFAPRWTGFLDAWTLEGEAQKLILNLRLTQQEAKKRPSSGYYQAIRIDTTNEYYEIGEVSLLPMVSFMAYQTIHLSDNVDLVDHGYMADDGIIYFNFLGAPQSSGYIQLRYKGQDKDIIIEPTGKMGM